MTSEQRDQVRAAYNDPDQQAIVAEAVRGLIVIEVMAAHGISQQEADAMVAAMSEAEFRDWRAKVSKHLDAAARRAGETLASFKRQ